MPPHASPSLTRLALSLVASLLATDCASRSLRDAPTTAASVERARTERIPSVFSLLERADGQRCRAARDGRLACCATLLDGREACWPRESATVDWRPQPTIQGEQAAASAPSTSLTPSVSCANTVDGRHGCCTHSLDGALQCWTDQHAPANDDPANGISARLVAGLRGVRHITAGGRRTCALLDDASVWCWGVNYDGRPVARRGQPLSWRHRAWTPVPVRVDALPAAVSIVDGGSVDVGGSLCAIATDLSVSCVDPSAWTQEAAPIGRVERIDGLRGATQIAIGSNHGCALTLDGGVWCWGDNSYGQLGRGTFDSTGDRRARRVELAPAAQIAAGWETTCARLRDASVWCWGSNFFGMVGDGSHRHANRPTRVAGLGAVAEIAMTHEHACARSDDGSIACWGSNSSAGSLVPVAVGRLPDATQLALGSFASCVLLRNATAACWGAFDLGAGVVQSSAPTALAGLSRATQLVVATPGGVAPTRARVCARTPEATVLCLGGARSVGED